MHFNFQDRGWSKKPLSAKRPKKQLIIQLLLVIVILAGYLLWAGYSYIVKSNNSGKKDVKSSNLIEKRIHRAKIMPGGFGPFRPNGKGALNVLPGWIGQPGLCKKPGR